jgi:uncharacterized protein
MIEHTFIHLPGVGLATESRWWRLGILTWKGLLDNLPGLVRGLHRRYEMQRVLESSLEQSGNPHFFAPLLRASELWRLYGNFAGSCAFLDIETSGGLSGWHDITVIGLSDGSSYQAFVQGQNMEEFEQAVEDFQLVVTFNGARFDLPCIHRYFRHFRANWIHIDLRFALFRLGMRGGLKTIEKQMGIDRPRDVQGMNGLDAVVLWNQYENGNSAALGRLIRYNREDVTNLKTLMDFAFQKLYSHLPLAQLQPLAPPINSPAVPATLAQAPPYPNHRARPLPRFVPEE